MPQSVYSWMGSPLHLVLDDDFAAAYNRAQVAFFKAQTDHKDSTGSEWNPTDPIWMEWTEEEATAWDKIAQLINFMVEMNGGSIHIKEEDCTSEYLVKL